MRAPVETTACTMPASIILEMTFPILAMVMAPESVSTTLQSGSRTMARVTSNASPRARPPKAVLDMARSKPGNEVTLSRSRLSRGTRPSERPSWNFAGLSHGDLRGVIGRWYVGATGARNREYHPAARRARPGSAMPSCLR